MTHNLSPWQANDLSGFYRNGQADAPAVHFLHGNGFCSTTLWPMAAHFPKEWSLLFTDVPGHGHSKQPNSFMPNWLRMSRDIGDSLVERLDSTAHDGVIGVGHSMGGIMTLMMAAERPKLFKRIVLLDPVLFSPEIILIQKLARKTGLWRRSSLVKAVSARRNQWDDEAAMREYLLGKNLYKHWSPEAMDAFIQDGTRTESGKLSLCCAPEWEASIFGSYPRGLWQAVRIAKIPVDIVVASHSYGFIQGSANKATKANSNIHWQPFDGGHCFPMEQPSEAARVVLKILAGG